MIKVEEIETAVAGLPTEQLDAFRTWFEAFDSDRFDARIERDALGGKLDGLASIAADEFRRGSAKEL